MDNAHEAEGSLLDQVSRRRDRRPLRELPRLLREAVALVFRASRREALIMVAITAAVGGMTALQLAITQRLLTGVLSLEQTGVRSILPELIAFVAALIVLGVFRVVQGERRIVLSELVTHYTQVLVGRAAADADLVEFERPAFHDRLQRCIANATTRPVEVTYALVAMASSLFAVAAVGAALLFIEPVLLALALVALGPVWLVNRRLSKLAFGWNVEETEDGRRRNYLLALMTMKEPAQELRAFSLGEFFAEQHGKLWDARIERLRQYTRNRIRIGVGGQLVNGVLFGIVIGALVWLLDTGRTSVADGAVAAGAILILGQRMSSMIDGAGRLYESALFLDDAQKFLDEATERRKGAPTGRPSDLRTELRVEDVHFRYPSGARDALDGVSLSIRRGEVVALVGANGSGKTTLAKVIAQLYEPSRGTVWWEGVDTRELDRTLLRDRIAVIFQDFMRYSFTAEENIGFGRFAKIDNREAIVDAATRAGAHEFVNRFQGGYETLLGPQFIGGVDLSIGQWQRMAIARAFFRDAEIVILDEPSSALDPDAEAALFERLRELCRGRAVVVISHRFSTVTSADRIYVLEHGKVAESGSHAELMRDNRNYARMFRVQAAQYLDNTTQYLDNTTQYLDNTKGVLRSS